MVARAAGAALPPIRDPASIRNPIDAFLLARYAADRVRNASAVWMGATLGCAECHDHKFDPYSARDFHAFADVFADVQQPGVGTPKPTLALPTAEQEAERARLDALIATLKAGVAGDEATAAWHRAVQAREALDRAIRRTITTVSGPPRVTRVLPRGDWMDETGAVVEPAVPRVLRPIATPGRRATRLDLAWWLVARDATTLRRPASSSTGSGGCSSARGCPRRSRTSARRGPPQPVDRLPGADERNDRPPHCSMRSPGLAFRSRATPPAVTRVPRGMT